MDNVKRMKGSFGGYMPFHGRVITRRPPAQLNTGEMSICNNFRNFYPGIRKRGGIDPLHSDPYCGSVVIECPQDMVGEFTEPAAQNILREGTTFSDVRDGPGTSTSFPPGSGFIIAPPPPTWRLSRDLVPFDTSLVTGQDVASASIRLAIGGAVGSPRICLALSTVNKDFPTFDPYLPADMDSFGALVSDDIIQVTGPDPSGVVFTFNAVGRQFLEDVSNGVYGPGKSATIIVMEYDHDYLNVEPSGFILASYLISGLCEQDPIQAAELTLVFGNNFPYSNWQFVKGQEEDPDTEEYERRTFLQLGDGTLLQATNEPPEFTLGAFGPTFFNSGGAPPLPASYTDIDGIMIFSDWINPHQLFAGNRQKILAAWVDSDTYTGADDYLSVGQDMWESIVDVSDTSFVVPALATGDTGILICTQTPATRFNFRMDTFQGNVSDVLVIDVESLTSIPIITNTTISGGIPFAQDGYIELGGGHNPTEVGGISGYWYRIKPTGSGWTPFELTNITYGNREFFPLEKNVWDGIDRIPAEVLVYKAAEDRYYTYAAGAVSVSELASADRIYIGTSERVRAFNIDPGEAPNDNIGFPATITDIDTWNGTNFQAVSYSDGSVGFSKRGQIPVGQLSSGSERHRFNQSPLALFWYEITVSAASGVAENTALSISYIPYLNTIEADFGPIGTCCAAFKDRAALAFSRFPNSVYVSSVIGPNVLNGSDFAVLQAGDGRPNKIVSMKKFHNELIVHQEERGKDGGCTTLFEGYSPTTFGRLVLSTRIGALNEDAVVVIDGSDAMVIRTDERAETKCYWVSRYGIYMTDGRTVTRISDDIQNYFDPRYEECLRRGYERFAWAAYDSSAQVVRFGIVSGNVSEEPNLFPVYDLTTGDWLFDTYEESDSRPYTFGEVDAGSGEDPVLQVHYGKCFAHVANIGLNDNTALIRATCQIEVNEAAALLELNEVWLRMLPAEGGILAFTGLEDGRIYTEAGEDIDMTPEEVGDDVRRERLIKKMHEESHLSLNLENAQLDTDVWLYDLNLDLNALAQR